MTLKTRVALFVELKAKPGKEAEVASFLPQSANPCVASGLATHGLKTGGISWI
jgi:hypothetical protein